MFPVNLVTEENEKIFMLYSNYLKKLSSNLLPRTQGYYWLFLWNFEFLDSLVSFNFCQFFSCRFLKGTYFVRPKLSWKKQNKTDSKEKKSKNTFPLSIFEWNSHKSSNCFVIVVVVQDVSDKPLLSLEIKELDEQKKCVKAKNSEQPHLLENLVLQLRKAAWTLI